MVYSSDYRRRGEHSIGDERGLEPTGLVPAWQLEGFGYGYGSAEGAAQGQVRGEPVTGAVGPSWMRALAAGDCGASTESATGSGGVVASAEEVAGLVASPVRGAIPGAGRGVVSGREFQCSFSIRIRNDSATRAVGSGEDILRGPKGDGNRPGAKL